MRWNKDWLPYLLPVGRIPQKVIMVFCQVSFILVLGCGRVHLALYKSQHVLTRTSALRQPAAEGVNIAASTNQRSRIWRRDWRDLVTCRRSARSAHRGDKFGRVRSERAARLLSCHRCCELFIHLSSHQLLMPRPNKQQQTCRVRPPPACSTPPAPRRSSCEDCFSLIISLSHAANRELMDTVVGEGDSVDGVNVNWVKAVARDWFPQSRHLFPFSFTCNSVCPVLQLWISFCFCL